MKKEYWTKNNENYTFAYSFLHPWQLYMAEIELRAQHIFLLAIMKRENLFQHYSFVMVLREFNTCYSNADNNTCNYTFTVHKVNQMPCKNIMAVD